MPKDYAIMPSARLTELNNAIAPEIPATTFTFKGDFISAGNYHVNYLIISTVRGIVSSGIQTTMDGILGQSDVKVTPAASGDRSGIISFRYYYNLVISGGIWIWSYHEPGGATSLLAPHAMPFDCQLIAIDLINQNNGANGTVTIRYRRANVDQGNLLSFGWGATRGRTIDVRSQSHFLQRGDTVAVSITSTTSPSIFRPIVTLHFRYPDIDQIDKTGQNYTLNTTGW